MAAAKKSSFQKSFLVERKKHSRQPCWSFHANETDFSAHCTNMIEVLFLKKSTFCRKLPGETLNAV